MTATRLPLLLAGLGLALGAAAVAMIAVHAHRDHRRRRAVIAALPRVMKGFEEDMAAELRRMVSES
ncbi:hypothetical protein [Methylorubrum zatmanii]